MTNQQTHLIDKAYAIGKRVPSYSGRGDAVMFYPDQLREFIESLMPTDGKSPLNAVADALADALEGGAVEQWNENRDVHQLAQAALQAIYPFVRLPLSYAALQSMDCDITPGLMEIINMVEHAHGIHGDRR
jgi:hypothetical protein